MVACYHVHSKQSKKEDKQMLWVCGYFLSDNYCLSLNPEHGCRGVLEHYLCKIRQFFWQNCKWIIYVCINSRRTVSIKKCIMWINIILPKMYDNKNSIIMINSRCTHYSCYQWAHTLVITGMFSNLKWNANFQCFC